ncbi:NAD(P)/FAD-dependent oxidoreductase [Listeria seeligeri]|uniref:NAD(P)/FAD-dependent oxidoreductase n=1 Tax=Listeria seeligeri TaxID=1640 RepID=UPI001629BC01|nr:NAD(P)/FAD-dependent oxidoreductase [Listeria seeligeri]MBC1723349.1 NAD(P)/FAD-dependent oxidoreductase [Listeria seeligeri]MBF2436581.1 NAD(P)/FAD-dependent oxidoreductase [Listeria seeligeri]MBF2480449.1 NAD(P)/FAD-dependent oxidoreductase [Listeria seeligeri]
MSNELYDVTIIGAGPVGLFAAFYSGLRSMKTKIIDAEPAVGGKVRYFFPEKIIRDIGGIPAISGANLVANLKEQAETFHPEIVCNERVVNVTKLTDGTFQLTSQNGSIHFSKTIVIAIGSGTFEVNRLEALHAENFPEAIYYDVKNIEQFRDKVVAVSGGGNSAIDWAQTLEPIAREVHLIYRGEDFKAHEESVNALKKSRVQIHIHHEISELAGFNNQLSATTLYCKQTKTTKTITTDALFINHGVKVDLGTMAEWGFELADFGIVVDDEMKTTVPGIFACGDSASYSRKIRIIAAGLHEGPIAINSAKKYLEPAAADEAMISTHHESFIN